MLSLSAEQQGLSIVAPSGLETPITVTLQPTTLERALDSGLSSVGKISARNRPPQQVTVEARLLHIAFDKETRHGVDDEEIIARLGNGRGTPHRSGIPSV